MRDYDVPIYLRARGYGKVDFSPRPHDASRRVGGHLNKRDFLDPCDPAESSTPSIRVRRSFASDGSDRKSRIRGHQWRQIVIEFADDEQAEPILVHAQPFSDIEVRAVAVPHGDGQVIGVSEKLAKASGSENIAVSVRIAENGCVTIEFPTHSNTPNLPIA